jgi:hypothetical protein
LIGASKFGLVFVQVSRGEKMAGKNMRLALGLCLFLGMAATDSFAVKCKAFKKENPCTLLETRYSPISEEFCEHDARAQGLYGCVHPTLNVPERMPGFDVDEDGEQIDLDDAQAPEPKRTWQCYGCRHPQPTSGGNSVNE